MEYLFSRDFLHKRLIKHKKILLVLDFDGTLSPIVRKPHHARMSPQFRTALLKLKRLENVYVAIISGRPIASLKSLINLDFAYYGGNHGIEIKGQGINFLCREVENNKKLLFKNYKYLKTVFGGMSGIIIENKGFSMALHYRCLKPEYKNEFKSRILRIKKEFSALPILWKKGHKVMELLPRTSCNKGTALQYLIDHFKNVYPIAIGDDDTDEDMFKVLKRGGMGIRVKRKKNSHAQFYLKSQREVLEVIKAVQSAEKI
ncbi:MAG: trehalose-phosphatase [Elusimicrobia bacterium]|nr:trehalose-phosphatase [Elusimicrobiota bacterium]